MKRLDWLVSTPVKKRGAASKGCERAVVDKIRCADGTTLSVQASRFHYCAPRDDIGPWSKVEVGFPSVKPPRTWKQYAETWSDPTGTVYAWVPVEVVRRFIKQHGGEK